MSNSKKGKAKGPVSPLPPDYPYETLFPPVRHEGKMTPADRVFYRLVWDDNLAVNDFDLGYEDRFKGVLFLPLTRFRHTGDETTEIPFHRVRVFRYKGKVIWDREHRVDQLDELSAQQIEEGAAAATTTILHSSIQGAVPVPILPPEDAAKSDEAVEEAEEEESDTEDLVSIVSFNVLFDVFDAEKLYTDWRIPLLCAEIEATNADIVGLQEVTEAIFTKLREASPVLRSRYYWTSVPDDVRSSQVILSRFPLTECVSVATAKAKRIVYALIDVNGTSVAVANVHLPSDYGGTAAVDRRVADLEMAIGHLAPFAAAVIVGDFNFGDQGAEQHRVQWGGMVDSYLQTRDPAQPEAPPPFKSGVQEDPGNPEAQARAEGRSVGGYTFDITHNALAPISCREHRYPRRLDRVLLRGLTPLSCTLFAQAPTKTSVPTHIPKRRPGAVAPATYSGPTKSVQLFPSDHFGVLVRATLDAAGVDAAAAGVDDGAHEIFFPCFQCALCVIPPAHLHDTLNAFRAKHDQGYPRWMPHINLLHPFVFPDKVDAAAARIRAALAGVEPFTVRLRDLDSFDSRRSLLFLRPDADDDALVTLQARLQAAFPACGRDPNAPGGYTPHLTLGQTARAGGGSAGIAEEFLQTWDTTTEFTLDHVSIVVLPEGGDRYTVVQEVPLGGAGGTPAAASASAAAAGAPTEMVMEDPQWGSRMLRPYTPADALEQWMLRVTQAAYARSAPTHISQRGAMYHIPSDALADFLRHHAAAYESGVDFYVEEVRGNPFRLYVDLDVLRTVPEAPDAALVEAALADMVALTGRWFGTAAACVATCCHGPWDSATAPTAVSKTGLRLYFQNIFVDAETYRAYLGRLAAAAARSPACGAALLAPDATPEGVGWAEVVDVKSADWERGRLLGTVKRRRDLGRRHALLGAFTAAGRDAGRSERLAANLPATLFATGLRLWDAPPPPGAASDNVFSPERLYTFMEDEG